MASTLYVETNYPIGYAKGQDPQADAFLYPGTFDFRLVIPGVCFMEALTVLNTETKARNRFLDELSGQIREAGRDATSDHAKFLLQHLTQARTEAQAWLQDFRTRLTDCLYQLSRSAEIVSIHPDIVLRCLEQPILDEPTDRLILHSILWHAESSPSGSKAFLSGNSSDFGQKPALEALAAVGVHYFSTSKAALGWLAAQADA